MGFSEFVARLRELHAKARAGTLDTSDRGEYDRDRDELSRALMTAQNLPIAPNQRPREAMRVAKMVNVELSIGDARVKSATVDLCARGFSSLLAQAPKAAESVPFTMKLPDGPLSGRARAGDVKRQGVNFRVGFAIDELPPADAQRLELFVFDEVLARFRK